MSFLYKKPCTPKLQPGDILLFHYKVPKIIGYAIQIVTENPYAHSAIYLGNNKIVEAKGRYGGVKIVDLPEQSYFACYKVFRPNKPLTSKEIDELRHYASKYVGTPYDYKSVTVYFFLFLMKYLFKIELRQIRSVPLVKRPRKKFFCHELTGTLYSLIGKPIKSSIHPSNIMAEDICNNNNFVEIKC